MSAGPSGSRLAGGHMLDAERRRRAMRMWFSEMLRKNQKKVLCEYVRNRAKVP